MVFKTITDRETISFTHRNHAVMWRDRLTIDQYVDREFFISQTPAVRSGLDVYGLFDPDLKSLLDLMVRPAWKFQLQDGSVVRIDVLAPVVGSVYTYPEFRGKGFARTMMDQLVSTCKEKYDSGFVTLFSEVGEMYSRNGFKSEHVPMTYVELSPKNGDINELLTENGANLVPYHELDELYNVYRDYESHRITKEVQNDGKTRVCIAPSADTANWFHFRSKTVNYALSATKDSALDRADSYEQIVAKLKTVGPKFYGIELRTNGVLKGFIVWTYEYTEATTAVVLTLYLNGNSSVSEKLMMLAVEYLSHEKEAVKLAVWELQIEPLVVEFLKEKYHAELGQKNSSLSAIRLCDDEEQAQFESGELVWELNNKLGWF